MIRIAGQNLSNVSLAFLLSASAILTPSSPIVRQGLAQETKVETLLVTSFGTPDVPGPDIMPEIFRINADGTGRKPLLPKKTMAFDPALAPDGKRIVFVATNGREPRDDKFAWGLFVLNADGSGRKRLTETKKADEYLLAPSWSPDGKKIAFCTFVFGFRGNGTAYSAPPRVHVVDADGQNAKQVEKVAGFNPSWSADGKRLLFTRWEDDGESLSLWGMDADGANPRQLVKPHGKGAMLFGAWSPDSKALAYTVIGADEPGVDGLLVAGADGSRPKRLAGGRDEICFGVRWSQGGKHLYFTRRDRSGPPLEKDIKNPEGGRDWGPSAVYSINVDDQKLRRVTPGKEREYVGGNFLFAMRTLIR
jgi:Tol biopolymer transport system component